MNKKKKLTKREMAIRDIKIDIANRLLPVVDRASLKYPKFKIKFNYTLDIK